MSGTTRAAAIASQGRGESRDGSALVRPPRRGRPLSPVTLIIAAATLLALGLRLYQLTRPGYLLGLTEYDDGPYFGSAVLLVHGALPYRDFLIVQPPGITLLMIPAALLSKVTGTAWGMAAGRILTSLAGAAAVPAAGLLVRHRGPLATVVVTGLCAVYPDSVQAAHTVLVEPWLVLFCLIGALAVFDGDRLTASRLRLAWGGTAFGFAGAVEPWAIFPVIVIAGLSLRWPRRLAVYAAGVAVGFGVPVVPFAALAPQQFYEATITAQIGNRAGATRVAIWPRLQAMTGLADLTRPVHLADLAVAAAIVTLGLGGPCLAAVATRRLPPALDGFALATTVVVVVAFLWPDQFHYHFGAFLAPFLGMAIALPASTLLAGHRPASGARVGPAWLRCPVTCLAGLAIMTMALVQAHWESAQPPHLSMSVISSAERLIPPGGCLLADEVSFSVVADRLVSDVAGCPLLLDATGTNYALSGGRDPETGAARFARVDAVWDGAFGHAQYVWLSGLSNHRVAWTPHLRSYFRSHFTQILSAGRAGALYRRIGLRPAG